jgi:O-antigen/teichoic acid export membrane protein
MGSRALIGMIWNLASMIATRVGGVTAQVVLGWTLPKEDFGLFGLAVLIIGVGQSVHNGGVRPVLVQQPEDFPRLASAGFRYAMLVAVFTAAVLLASAPLLTALLDRPGLTLLLCIGALSFPLQVPPLIYQAKLAVELRFRRSAAVMVGGGTVRSGTMIASGFAGLGAVSFVSHYVVTAAFEWLLLRRVAGPWPRGVKLDRVRFVEFARSGRWLVLGTLGSTMALHGEKLLVDRWGPALLASYFFGSQLVLGITNLLQAGFSNVLLPTFARMGNDRSRQTSAYLRSLRSFSLFSASACIALALASPALVHLTWQGKWDESIPVVQSLSVALLSWLLGQLSLQVVSAMGAWRLHASLIGLDALTLMVAAGLGARSGNLPELALWVAGQRFLWGLVQVAVTAIVVGIPRLEVAAAVAVPASAGVGAGCATWALASWAFPPEPSLLRLLGTLAIYASCFSLLAGLFLRPDLKTLLSLVRARSSNATDPS